MDYQVMCEEYAQFESPLISDALRLANLGGTLHCRIRPVIADVKLVGRARTVYTYLSDASTMVQLISQAEPGDCLVVQTTGGEQFAFMGELMTTAAMKMKMSGAVIEGCIRDIQFIRQNRFPIFAIGLTPYGAPAEGFGYMDVPVVVGGVAVKSGDIIVGDDNGVVVVPKEHGEKILEMTQNIKREEEKILAALHSGKKIEEVLNFNTLIEAQKKKRSAMISPDFILGKGDAVRISSPLEK